jgi:predicted HTH transcriptional regulator
MATHLYSPIITSADFTQQVHLGRTPETTTLEFKKDLDRWRNRPEKERKDAQKEFCRDVSQFANSYGGCLLLGVEEHLVNGQRIAGSVHSLDSIDDRRGWMEQAVHNYLTPSTTPLFIHGITTADGSLIISVNVPPSERLVAVWD